ncbi:MAG: hypothetical protein P1V97_37085, partial [Planctomycetota bacterium]|nr:hypothetical protein [Planctomycetota bacterium]
MRDAETNLGIGLDPTLSTKLVRFAKNRKDLGQLKLPDKLAEYVLLHRATRRVVIRVEQVGLNIDT